MIHTHIPGWGELRLQHLVMDYNGTLAVDGVMIPGVAERLLQLNEQIDLHVITADTFGKARQALTDLPCSLCILSAGDQAVGKRDFINLLGADQCVSMGNGRNDEAMLRESALGIAILGEEGAAASTLMAADIVCASICDALDLLLQPLRLTATLRS